MLKIPPPRLLPGTIVVLVLMLLLKSGLLLHTAVNPVPKSRTTMVNAATAATTEQTKEPTKAQAPAKPHGAARPGPEPQQPVPVPPANLTPPVSESERALLQELRQRREALDARGEAITTRESVLAAAEQKLAGRVDELRALQNKLQGLDAAQKQKEDAGWQGLVKLYEAMKPKDAATIFNDLPTPVLIQLLDRMKDAKAALVMAAMNPDRARDATAELAQLRTGRDFSGAPATGAKNASAGG